MMIRILFMQERSYLWLNRGVSYNVRTDTGFAGFYHER